MDNGASSYRRFLEGDESAFESIMQDMFTTPKPPRISPLTPSPISSYISIGTISRSR